MWWANMSGGTDFAGAFIGANRELPQTPGLMQCRLLGAAVEAFNEQGRAVIEEVGELVCTEPMPSMPLYFWNDEGDARYRASYFETYPDNFDGTRPRRGVAPWRLAQDQCRRLLRDLWPQRRHHQPARPAHGHQRTLFRDRGAAGGAGFAGRRPRISRPRKLHAAVRGAARRRRARRARCRRRINKAIEAGLSRRFLPNEIFAVAEIPRTLSGKKQELPIKKLLLGHPVEKVINKDAMANPGCLDWYLEFAGRASAAECRGGVISRYLRWL